MMMTTALCTRGVQPKPRTAHSFSSTSCTPPAFNRRACSLKAKAINSRSRITCNAAPQGDAAATEKPIPTEVLTGDDLESWTATTAMVQEATGITAEEAEEVVTRAFGWGSQLYWRKSKVQEVPQTEQVEESIAYLKSMLPKQDQLVKVIKGFPECVAIGVEAGPPGLKYAFEYIDKEWDMQPPVSNMVIAKKPKLLGNSVDAEARAKGCATSAGRHLEAGSTYVSGAGPHPLANPFHSPVGCIHHVTPEVDGAVSKSALI
eukprot:CAMPEP_0118934866 /NCGR_PEP_ID=MMETSP1169-20130426/14340_1 /TAXON_ID=36882 /ORGANISM="Pyramimonas obovata, Strain CCMP722" /LENGTH=260 /DNA_ID=CAMNT_0006877815 /DNA_START=80 /DNA_END=863 /DNA_ORIENTATION=-